MTRKKRRGETGEETGEKRKEGRGEVRGDMKEKESRKGKEWRVKKEE